MVQCLIGSLYKGFCGHIRSQLGDADAQCNGKPGMLFWVHIDACKQMIKQYCILADALRDHGGLRYI